MSLCEHILSLAAVIVDTNLGDEISIFCLFSVCSWLVAGGGIICFPLYHASKYLIWPVALQYLKYQIMLTIIIMTIFPMHCYFINNQLGITDNIFLSFFQDFLQMC